jgi:hypothetical protein
MLHDRSHSADTLAVVLQELRRGADPACIYSLAFSRAETPEWLAVSSDKGTVHVFKLTIGERSAVAMAAAATNGTTTGGTANPVSPLSFVSVRAVPDVPPCTGWACRDPPQTCRRWYD